MQTKTIHIIVIVLLDHKLYIQMLTKWRLSDVVDVINRNTFCSKASGLVDTCKLKQLIHQYYPLYNG